MALTLNPQTVQSYVADTADVLRKLLELDAAENRHTDVVTGAATKQATAVTAGLTKQVGAQRKLYEQMSLLTSAVGGQGSALGKLAFGAKALVGGFGGVGIAMLGAGTIMRALDPVIDDLVSGLGDLLSMGDVSRWEPWRQNFSDMLKWAQATTDAVAAVGRLSGAQRAHMDPREQFEAESTDLANASARAREHLATLEKAVRTLDQSQLSYFQRSKIIADWHSAQADAETARLKEQTHYWTGRQKFLDAEETAREAARRKDEEGARRTAAAWEAASRQALAFAAEVDALNAKAGMGPGGRKGDLALAGMLGMSEEQVRKQREGYTPSLGWGDKGLLRTIEAQGLGGEGPDIAGLGDMRAMPRELGPSRIERLFGKPEEIDAVAASFAVLADGVNAAFGALASGEGAGKAWEAIQKTISSSLAKLMFRYAKAEAAHAAASFAIGDGWGFAGHTAAAGLFVAAGAYAGSWGGGGGGGGSSGGSKYGSFDSARPTLQTSNDRPTIIVLGHGFADDQYLEAQRIRKGLDYSERMSGAQSRTVRFE